MYKLKMRMIEKSIYLNELSRKTELNIVRLNKIVNSRIIPDLEEINKINKILNLSLEIKDFKIDYEKENEIYQMAKAFNLVYEDAKNKKKGSIICPVCNKRLHYVKHSNGHIWGKCETENCIQFMQ
jgi:transcriptional regulator with XRE-family HTH domain